MAFHSRRWAAVAVAVLAVTVGAVVLLQPASAATGLDPVAVAQAQRDNCALLAAHTSVGTAQHDRATKCVTDQNAILALLVPVTPTTTVSASPTAGPTTSPTAPPTTVPVPTTTPSTTPPTGPQTGCAAHPSSCGYPDATNTGVPDGTKLTVTSGNLNLAKAGDVIDGQEIHGCVSVSAANVTIRDSRIIGDGCFYAVRNFSTGLRLENVEITCGGTAGTGVVPGDYTVTRSDITGCENGFAVGNNVTVEDSWIHGLFRGPGSHTDGAQFDQGGGPITFRHNTIAMGGGDNSAIIMWDEGNPQNHDVVISNNILQGGGYTLYCPRNAAPNDSVTGNRYAGPVAYGYSNGCGGDHTDWSGNVRDDTGAPIPAQ